MWVQASPCFYPFLYSSADFVSGHRAEKFPRTGLIRGHLTAVGPVKLIIDPAVESSKRAGNLNYPLAALLCHLTDTYFLPCECQKVPKISSKK